MKLFETAFRNGWNYTARFYDTNLKRSMTETIDPKVEYYEEDPYGMYSYVIDPTIKLRKVLGRSKDSYGKYGVLQPIYRHIRDNYFRERQYNLNPNIWYLDIETRSGTVSSGFPDPSEALEPVCLIQIFDSSINTMIVLGLRDWEQRDDYKLEYNVKYIKCNNEEHMFDIFNKLFFKLDPLIVYAWNGKNFDFPYLVNRAKNLGIQDLFANYGQCSVEKHKLDNGNLENKITTPGHYFFDMIDVYKTIVLAPRPSYALDTIARIELDDHKIEHNEYLNFDSFYTGEKYQISESAYSDTLREEIRLSQIKRRDLKKDSQEYLENEKVLQRLISFQFVYYGIYDVYLLKKLDDKIKMSNILMNMSSMMGGLASDMLSTVKKWSQYICNIIYEKNLIAPIAKRNEKEQIVGGFVRKPVVGKHRWILNADVNSMYPMLSMSAFNMSFETYIPRFKLPNDLKEIVIKYFNNQNEDERLKLPKDVWNVTSQLLKKYNYSLSVSGAVFDCKQRGIIPSLVDEIYANRKKAKGMMLKNENLYERIRTIYDKCNGSKNNFDVEKLLDLSDVELQEFSKKTLDEILKYAHNEVERLNVEQLTLKILMNSLYGALGKEQFLFFNADIARAITSNGRFFIKKLANNIEYVFQKMKPSEKKYIIYGDTDSVLGDTVINTNLGKMKIEDLYKLDGDEVEYKQGKFIKTLNENVTSKCVNNLKLDEKRINYVMKHHVKKQMFKIKVKDKSVIVTCDHSILVMRNGKLISVKPSEITSSDLICKI